MDKAQIKQSKRLTRRNRIRAKVTGTAERPRLSIHRSNTRIYAQLIDDTVGKTLVSGESGKDIAEKAVKLGIKSVVFDRGGFNYTGRVKSFADEARAAGLQF